MERDSSGRFTPGQSGNPAGRPKGGLSRTTLLAKALVQGQEEAIVRRALNDATQGTERMRMRLLPLLLQWLLPGNRSEEEADYLLERMADLEQRVKTLEEQPK